MYRFGCRTDLSEVFGCIHYPEALVYQIATKTYSVHLYMHKKQ